MNGANKWFRVIRDFFMDITIPYFFFCYLYVIFSVPEHYCRSPLSASLIIIFLTLFKSYKVCRSLLVRLLYLSFGISVLINFSSKLLMYTSMAASILLKLRVDFGSNCSRSNSFSSFLKCHFNILPSASNSVLSFALTKQN